MLPPCPAPFFSRLEYSRARRPHGRQRGQGAAEFLLAAVPVLLIGLGGIEAAHWYFVRQAVSLALVQAGRAAITQHAHPAVLDQAFMRALLPLHAGPTPAVSQSRLRRAMARREHDTGLPAWRIRILSPSAASFSDFSSQDPDLPREGPAVIDNDYLHERHQARLAQGWHAGRGPLSGQTTLEANTLVLHLTWLHRPLLPGVRQLLKQLAPADARYGSQAMAGAGYLPMQRQLSFVMQSHAMAWDMPSHGRIVRAAGAGPVSEDAAAGPVITGDGGSAQAGGPSDAGPAPYDAGPSASSENGTNPPAPQAGTPESPNPTAHGPPRACIGLWCLDEAFAPGSRQDAEAAQASAAGEFDGNGVSGNGASQAAPGGNDSYLEAGADPDWPAPPAGPDDCPGCCA